MTAATVSPRWQNADWLLAATLAVLTTVAYLPALQGGFIWNDSDYVTASALQSFAGLRRIWFEVGATEQYYPLLHSAFWLQHRLWGDSAFGHHAVNVLLHIGNALLLVMVVRRLAIRGAWLASFLFALHPVCVESAAWIAEQKNTLSTFFYLLTAIAYLRFDASRKPADYAFASVLFVAALLSKTLTATLTGALLVVVWWQRGRISWRRDVRPLVPWIVVGAAAGLFSGWFERKMLSAEGADFDLTLLQRTLLSARVVWFYLGKLVWPHDLIFIYPRWQIQPGVWWQYLYPLTLVLLIAGLVWLSRRQRGPLAALLFFLGSVFPVSGFFNVYGFLFSYVADHWQYLPSIGFFVFVAAGGAALVQKFPALATARWFAVPLVLATLSFLTWRQSGLYRDIVTFYKDTIAANPACWMAHNNLGIIYGEAGNNAEAARHYEAALRLKPDRFEIHNNLGLVYVASAQWQEAVNHFERAIQLNPRSHVSYNSIGTILRNAGRNEEALGYYRKSIEINPDYIDGYNNLGLTLLDLQKIPEALVALEIALSKDPTRSDTHNNLGVGLTNAGQHERAEAHLRRAIALNANYPSPHDNLGNLLRKTGRLPEAIQEYQTALRLNPNAYVSLVNLCLALVDAKRFPEAVEAGKRAVQLSPETAEAHFNLALALQGAGSGTEAAAHYETAHRLKPSLPRVPTLERRG